MATPRLQRILDSISDAVLIVQGGSLDIVDANQAALDVTGFRGLSSAASPCST